MSLFDSVSAGSYSRQVKPEFIQERVKIEFLYPGVEAVGLELLDEVAVDVLEVMHHL